MEISSEQMFTFTLSRVRGLIETLPTSGLPVWIPPGDEVEALHLRLETPGFRYVASLFATIDHEGYYEVPLSAHVAAIGVAEPVAADPMGFEALARLTFTPWVGLDPAGIPDRTEPFLQDLEEDLALIAWNSSLSFEVSRNVHAEFAGTMEMVLTLDLSFTGPESDLPGLVADRVRKLVRLASSLPFLQASKRCFGSGLAARRLSAEEVRAMHRGVPGETLLPGDRDTGDGASTVDGQ